MLEIVSPLNDDDDVDDDDDDDRDKGDNNDNGDGCDEYLDDRWYYHDCDDASGVES